MEPTKNESESPSIEARVYHLEREDERLARNAHGDRNVLNATVLRLAVIETKNAIWGGVAGAIVAALIALIEFIARHF